MDMARRTDAPRPHRPLQAGRLRAGALAAWALALSAGQAAALSCAVPSAAETYARADAAAETYMVVLGDISFDPALMPTGGSNDARGARVPARIDGLALSAEGFTSPISTSITLDVTCAGPWCGGIGPGEHIAFIERTASGWVLDVGPCPGSSFDPGAEAEIVACARGGC